MVELSDVIEKSGTPEGKRLAKIYEYEEHIREIEATPEIVSLEDLFFESSFMLHLRNMRGEKVAERCPLPIVALNPMFTDEIRNSIREVNEILAKVKLEYRYAGSSRSGATRTYVLAPTTVISISAALSLVAPQIEQEITRQTQSFKAQKIKTLTEAMKRYIL